jgi:predicted transcriptional regulator of viral defense system
MRFLEFRNALKDFQVFSYPDILKVDPLFDRRRLVEWQHKNYIRKIRNGFYNFKDEKISEGLLLYTSNIIYKPSYISLESALSFHNLIPEAVYLINAISTKKTSSFETPDASYNYRNIKEELFFGYEIVSVGDYNIKIADPQKTILDYLYFKLLNSKSELEGLRLNIPTARELISIPKIESYLSLYESKTMETRVKLFLNYLYAES